MGLSQFSGVAYGVAFTEGVRETFLRNLASVLNEHEPNCIDDVDEFISFPSDAISTLAKFFPTVSLVDWFDEDNGKAITIAYVRESFYKSEPYVSILPVSLNIPVDDMELRVLLTATGTLERNPFWVFFSYIR